jgi:hypothetical protein
MPDDDTVQIELDEAPELLPGFSVRVRELFE